MTQNKTPIQSAEPTSQNDDSNTEPDEAEEMANKAFEPIEEVSTLIKEQTKKELTKEEEAELDAKMESMTNEYKNALKNTITNIREGIDGEEQK